MEVIILHNRSHYTKPTIQYANTLSGRAFFKMYLLLTSPLGEDEILRQNLLVQSRPSGDHISNRTKLSLWEVAETKNWQTWHRLSFWKLRTSQIFFDSLCLPFLLSIFFSIISQRKKPNKPVICLITESIQLISQLWWLILVVNLPTLGTNCKPKQLDTPHLRWGDPL